MKIEHLAIWVKDPEKMKDFYLNYFSARCSEKYRNVNSNFSSYFLSFDEKTSRLEIMQRPDVTEGIDNRAITYGISHLAFSAGSRLKVDELTARLRSDGYNIIGEPRVTGDGYYESVVEDCEGNRIEITE